MKFLHHGITLEFEGFLLMDGFLEFLRKGGLIGFELNEFLGGGLRCADGLLGLRLLS